MSKRPRVEEEEEEGEKEQEQEKKKEQKVKLPPGWEMVESITRPGMPTYVHKETGRRVSFVPKHDTPSIKPVKTGAAASPLPQPLFKEEAVDMSLLEEEAREVAKEAEEEEAKKKALEEEEEATKKALEEEKARKKARKEAKKKKAMEEEAKKKAMEEEAIEEEARRRAMEEEEVMEEARKKAMEEAAKKKAIEEEARKKAMEEEAAKKKAMEEEAKKRAIEEEAKNKAIEEEAKKKAIEEEAKKKAIEDEAKKKAMEEAAKKKAIEEEAKKKAREEAAKKKAIEEAARKKAMEEEAKKKAIEVAALKKAMDGISVEVVRYSSQRTFIQVAGDRRFPIGFESITTLRGGHRYRNEVNPDGTFSVSQANAAWHGATCNLAWESASRDIAYDRALPLGFDLFGFSQPRVSEDLADLEADVALVSFSRAGEEDEVTSAFRKEVMQCIRDNQSTPAAGNAGLVMLCEHARIGKLFWAPAAAASAALGRATMDFPKYQMRLHTAIEVVGFCGLLSPHNALLMAKQLVARPSPPQHFLGFTWNNLQELTINAVAEAGEVLPPPLSTPCKTMRSKLTLPIKRLLPHPPHITPVDLDCTWSAEQRKYQVRLGEVLLAESQQSGSEALQAALQSSLLIQTLKGTAPATAATAATAPLKRERWVPEPGERVDLEMRQGKMYVTNVVFLLKNCLLAPRPGDQVLMAKQTPEGNYISDECVPEPAAIVFIRRQPLPSAKRNAKPTRLFPSLSRAMASEHMMGAMLFGFGMPHMWRLESDREQPTLPSTTLDKHFSFNVPGLMPRYRAMQHALREAIALDVESALCLDDFAWERDGREEAARCCFAQSLLDRDVVLEEELAAARCKLLPQVSCHELYLAKGQPVRLKSGAEFSGYKSRQLSGLRAPLDVLNGMYVLREQEDGEEGRVERWVFCGGPSQLSGAFAGLMAMFAFHSHQEEDGSEEVKFVLSRFPGNDEAVAAGTRTAGGDKDEWFVVNQGQWEPCAGVRFVTAAAAVTANT